MRLVVMSAGFQMPYFMPSTLAGSWVNFMGRITSAQYFYFMARAGGYFRRFQKLAHFGTNVALSGFV
jgi:hypothetical protein